MRKQPRRDVLYAGALDGASSIVEIYLGEIPGGPLAAVSWSNEQRAARETLKKREENRFHLDLTSTS